MRLRRTGWRIAGTLVAIGVLGFGGADAAIEPFVGPLAFRLDGPYSASLTVRIVGTATPAGGTRLPLTLEATYRFVDVPSAVVEGAVVRRYDEATSTITVGNGRSVTTTLRPDRAVQRVYLDSGGVAAAAVGGPLTHAEAGLLDLPCDPLALAGLVRDGVTAGDDATWEPDEAAVAAFVGFDVVTEAEVAGSNDGQSESTSITGKVDGADDGTTVSTSWTLSARTWRQVSALSEIEHQISLTRTDRRETGPVSPGLEAETTARLVLTELRPPVDRLPNPAGAGRLEAIARLPDIDPTPPEEPPGLAVTLPAGAATRVASDWRLFHGSPEVVVLRLLRDGRLVAQANVTAVERLSPGEATAADRFRADIANAAGVAAESLGEPVVGTREDGVRFARVAVAADVPGVDGSTRAMEWRYVLLTAADGRQLTILFTLDAADAEGFGPAESTFVDAVSFGAHPVAEAN